MLLSIIIPIYKVEKYIVDCIESIVVQLRPEHSVEIICINDGTPDRSMDILKGYLLNLDTHIQNKFKLVDQDNKGLSGARNKGLEIAQGKYISFLDSDDKLYSSYLDVILGTINKNDFDILDFNIKNSNGLEFHTRSELNSEKQLDTVFKAGNWFACARVYNKKMFISQRFTVGIYYEDLDLIPILYLNAKKCIHLENVLYWYRLNPEGITQNVSDEAKIKTIESLEKILNKYICLNYCDNNYIRFLILHLYYVLCIYSCRFFGYSYAIDKFNKYKKNFKKIKRKVFFSKKILIFFNFSPSVFLLIYSCYLFLKKKGILKC